MGGVGKGTTRQITGIVRGRHERDARHLYVVVVRLIKSAVREMLNVFIMYLLSVRVLMKVRSLSYLSNNKSIVHITCRCVYLCTCGSHQGERGSVQAIPRGLVVLLGSGGSSSGSSSNSGY